MDTPTEWQRDRGTPPQGGRGTEGHPYRGGRGTEGHPHRVAERGRVGIVNVQENNGHKIKASKVQELK